MSVFSNGLPTKPFRMKRGLIQGDPLSPVLFVLVADVFNKMLGRAKEIGIFEGIQIGREEVVLSHLQFADDTILFCPAKEEVVLNYRCLLDSFGLMSGLQINFDKFALIPLSCEEG